jgi:hypothetical protein
MQVHMEAFPTAGIYDGCQLNAAYLIRHANSLVGKELKLLAQCASGFLAPLVKSGEVTQELWRSWLTCGQLARLLLIEQASQTDQELYMVHTCIS